MSSTIGVCAIYNRTGSRSVGHVFSPSQSRLVVQEDFEHREDAAASNVETQSTHDEQIICVKEECINISKR